MQLISYWIMNLNILVTDMRTVVYEIIDIILCEKI